MGDIKFELTAEEAAEIKAERSKTRIRLGGAFAAATVLGLGALALQSAFDRWTDMELDRQEGQRHAFSIENTEGTSNLGCFANAAGSFEIRGVDTGEVYEAYVIQGQDGTSCYFTDGPHQATGSVVYNAAKM